MEMMMKVEGGGDGGADGKVEMLVKVVVVRS